ncbi:MAG: hypothetical protein H6696_07235 [Deferribacteres bacterium]|nr:hypothetical protein [candidate division KSB1 bacterium]MCB9501716.1 hypothetical protein [Deferribacteres bacterium]
MNELKDARPIFLWAQEHGDTRIVERILVRVLPILIERKIELTVDQIESEQTLFLPVDLVNSINSAANELVDSFNLEGDCRV